MKACSKCGVSKPESDYFIKSRQTGRLHAQCKTCYQAHRQSYYNQHYAKYRDDYLNRARIRRAKLQEEFHLNMLTYLKDKFCVVCGEDDIRVLEFDHIYPEEKEFSISEAVRRGYAWDKTLDEMKKCRILCANCHKKHTSTQFSWYKA